jgi:hypothetical protein
MRKALLLLTMIGLAAPCAFGQTLTALDGHESDGPEVAVFLRPISGQSVEVLAMSRLLVDAVETSRTLNRVDILGNSTMQLEAPTTLTRRANGAEVLVTYEVWPIRGLEQRFSTSCPADQPERCVEDIVRRTERMALMDPTRR